MTTLDPVVATFVRFTRSADTCVCGRGRYRHGASTLLEGRGPCCGVVATLLADFRERCLCGEFQGRVVGAVYATQTEVTRVEVHEVELACLGYGR